MPEALKVNKGAEACLRDFLKFLLEKERVKGVFCLRETGGGAAYSLITDPAALDEAVPLFPLLPASAAKVLANLTLVEPAAEPIAVVIKPCELRALTELMKRNQGSLENLLLISFTCAGAYPLEMSVNGDIEAKLPAYWEAVKKAEIPADIRPACAACEHFVPYNADITLELVGNKDADKKCLMHLNNEKAEQFAQGFEGESGGGEIDAAVIDSLKAKRQEKKQALFTELGI
jgi:formate dehydrogenase subunit beta